jgi:hypothetical protein
MSRNNQVEIIIVMLASSKRYARIDEADKANKV